MNSVLFTCQKHLKLLQLWANLQGCITVPSTKAFITNWLLVALSLCSQIEWHWVSKRCFNSILIKKKKKSTARKVSYKSGFASRFYCKTKLVGIYTLWLPNTHGTSGYRIAYILGFSCLWLFMGKLILWFKSLLRTTGWTKAHYFETLLSLACYLIDTRDSDEKGWIWWPGDHSFWVPILRIWRASSAQIWQLKEATAFVESESLMSWKLMGWTLRLVMALPFRDLLSIVEGFTD